MNRSGEDFLGELRLGRKLKTVPQAASAGILITLGLVILLADPLLKGLGTKAPFVPLLALLLFTLNLLNVLEMLAGSGDRGGAYTLVYEVLGGWGAMLTGAAILAGALAVTAALTRLAVLELSGFAFFAALPASILAAGFLTLLLLVQFFHIDPARISFRLLVLPLLAALLFEIVTSLTRINLDVFRRPVFELEGTARAAALMATGYLAFEALFSERRQVRAALRVIPRALVLILGVLTILSFLVFFDLAGQNVSTRTSTIIILDALSVTGWLPPWVLALLFLVILFFAAHTALSTAAFQIQTLILEGALPAFPSRVRRSLRTPLIILALSAGIVVPLLLFAPADWLLPVAAALFLVAMSLLDLAAIVSRSREPDRRRTVVLPFAPLIPLLAIALNVGLLGSLPVPALAASGVWLAAASGLYFLFALPRQAEHRSRELSIGAPPDVPDRDGHRPRILVPLEPGEEHHLVLSLALSLSQQTGAMVLPLQVIPVPDPLAIEDGRRMARQQNHRFRWSLKQASELGVPVYPITRLARSVPEGILETAEEEDCTLILLAGKVEAQGRNKKISPVIRRVVDAAPCDVAALTYNPQSLRPEFKKAVLKEGLEDSQDGSYRLRRILVPAAGGPNAPRAIELAVHLAREYGATVTPLYAAPLHPREEDRRQGLQRLQATIEFMRSIFSGEVKPDHDGLDGILTEGKIASGPSVTATIAEASQSYDLIIMGASEEGIVDRFLFGDIPEQVSLQAHTPVMIVRRFEGLPRLWLHRLWASLFGALPQLDEEEQITIYRATHRSARPDIDFFVMIALSALITTFGLVLNNLTVVIGAMLVAPLFSPILATSLAVVDGNVRLLWLAVESTLKGLALMIAIAILLTLIIPYQPLTEALRLFSEPSLIDLLIALGAGAAGAYAASRKDVSSALPGVAISVSLEPPLATVGISLASGELLAAGGAALLFLTNLVAIILAGALVFFLLGFRPGSASRETHLRRGLLVTLVSFTIIAVPLLFFFVQSVQNSRMRSTIEATISASLEEIQGVDLVSPDEIRFATEGDVVQVTVPVYVQHEIPSGLAAQLSAEVNAAVARPVHLRLVPLFVVSSPP